MNKDIAEAAYTAYREAVGGKAFNGDPLPTWTQMCLDSKKEHLVRAWRAAADAVEVELSKAVPYRRE